MPLIQTHDIEIYYERVGSGPRLLFISGTGSDLRKRPNVLDGPFSRHFDMLTYDQRGLGRTSKPDTPYTMKQYADDAASLMKAIGWNSAHIIGVSFGGMVAQELAINHPEMVEKLVLACTSPGGEGGASYPLHKLAHMSREARARHMISISDTRHNDEWAKANPETYESMIAMASADPYADEAGHETGQQRQLEARAAHDTWDRLSEIRSPTLICGGLYDGIALPETQEKMAQRIPDAELRFFEGGHLFMLQDRSALPAMTEFLLQEA